MAPWTISIHTNGEDWGRLVGFEGQAQVIIGMHQLKPDPGATRAVEITVFRVNDELRARRMDAGVFAAFERWLLKRGWKGNIIKKLHFISHDVVIPIRRFWVSLGFELVPGEDGKWEEHAVKRWR
jgi:hypothetical protein